MPPQSPGSHPMVLVPLFWYANLTNFTDGLLDSEAATGGVLYKKLFLKTFNIHRKTPMLESLFQACNAERPVILLQRDSNVGASL